MTDTMTELQPDPATEVRPRRVTGGKLVSNLVLLFFGIGFLVPLVWLLLASVDKNATGALAWPTFTLDNFAAATSGNNLNALLNSGDEVLMCSGERVARVDLLLAALGRRSNVDGLNLAAGEFVTQRAGVALHEPPRLVVGSAGRSRAG